MDRTMISRGAALALGGVLAGVALAGAPRYAAKPPELFIPLDRVIIMTTGEPESRPLLVIDLTAGAALKDCPSGSWSGKAVFVGGVGGDVEWEGQFWRCFPFGQGSARYPNDTTYTGQVNSYVDAGVRDALINNRFDERVIDADSVAVAVREGKGTSFRGDGKASPGLFRRGEQFTPSSKQPDQRLANYDSSLAALMEAGRQAVLEAERKREEARLAELARQAEAARLAEEARLAEAARVAEAARQAEEAARQMLLAVATDAATLRGQLDGSTPAAAPAKPGAPSCVNALAAQRKFFAAVNQRRPADATLVADLKTTLYEIDARAALLGRSCAGQPEQREQATLTSAKERLERACQGVTGDAAQCAPDIAW